MARYTRLWVHSTHHTAWRTKSFAISDPTSAVCTWRWTRSARARGSTTTKALDTRRDKTHSWSSHCSTLITTVKRRGRSIHKLLSDLGIDGLLISSAVTIVGEREHGNEGHGRRCYVFWRSMKQRDSGSTVLHPISGSSLSDIASRRLLTKPPPNQNFARGHSIDPLKTSTPFKNAPQNPSLT